MKKNITYKWGTDYLTIDLGDQTEPRIQALFWGEVLFTIGMATIILVSSFPIKSGWISTPIAIFSAVLYILASYRFLQRMFIREKIVLSDLGITLVRKTIFANRARSFEWENISPLYYYSGYNKTAHPLKGHSFDYFGFETHEHLVQKLHHEGNLYFNYEGYPVHFARGVYSWHAEDMVYMMKLFAGANLRLGPEWKQLLRSQQVDDE